MIFPKDRFGFGRKRKHENALRQHLERDLFKNYHVIYNGLAEDTVGWMILDNANTSKEYDNAGFGQEINELWCAALADATIQMRKGFWQKD
jgi:hypothetical protein